MVKKYFGQIGKLKPEMVEEYKTLHAAVWPEVLAMIGECGLRNYSIFLTGETVFSYFEYVGENYEADMAKMAADPATKRWWTFTHPCFDTSLTGDFYTDCEQIFYFSGESSE